MATEGFVQLREITGFLVTSTIPCEAANCNCTSWAWPEMPPAFARPLDLSQFAIMLYPQVLLVHGCGVRIISRRRLREFWQSLKHREEIAERDLSAWFKLAKNALWNNFAALRQTFGSADQVGNCVVFDVGNNRFRIIGRVNYKRGIVYVLRVMDHREYDRKNWIDDCGCHKPPPRPSVTRKPMPRRGLPSRRRKRRR
jgi:mRNA interferase HigB